MFSFHVIEKKETKLIKEIKHTKESKTTTTNTLQIIASLAQDMNEHHVRMFYCMRVGKNARRYPLSHQNAIATSDEVIVKNRYRHIRLDVANVKQTICTVIQERQKRRRRHR